MAENTAITSVSVCTYADFNDTDQLLGYFDRIRKLNKPLQFSSQIVNIDTDEMTNSEIIIAKSGTFSSVEPGPNRIEVNVREGSESEPDQIHIHMHGDEEWELANTVYEKIVGVVDEVETYLIHVDAEVDVGFDELELPVQKESDYEIGGINFKEDTNAYLIQRTRDDGVTFRYTELDEFYIDQSEAGNIVNEMRAEMEELVHQFRS